MTTPAILLIAGTIVTSQGAAWVPVSPKTMLEPVPAYVYPSSVGAVVRYKNGVEQTPNSRRSDDRWGFDSHLSNSAGVKP